MAAGGEGSRTPACWGWGDWGYPAGLGDGTGQRCSRHLLLPAAPDAGDGQAGACPSLQHGWRVPAHRHCSKPARDARAKCSEGDSW